MPFDLHGLANALGGATQAAARLAQFESQLNSGPTTTYAFLGNEPTIETPWEFDWFGQPWQTQATVRRALLSLWNTSPGGFPGNDDLGTMSSWYVFSALGFYPEIPGVGIVAIGSPLFPSATLHLAGGTVTINTPGNSDTTPYVQSLTLNGQLYTKPWLPVSTLLHGAAIGFTLGTAPNTSWGSNPRDVPPSFDATSGTAGLSL